MYTVSHLKSNLKYEHSKYTSDIDMGVLKMQCKKNYYVKAVKSKKKIRIQSV